MTDESDNGSWEAWLAGVDDDPDVERYKWGWNEVDGETVWQVGGSGDGRPAHVEQLSTAWGRRPDASAGDVLGVAEYLPARDPDPACVVIDAYYGGRVPGVVVDWFRDAFPDAEVRVSGQK